MSSYSIPVISFESIIYTNFSKRHILAFCCIKDNKCNGPICLILKLVSSLRWMDTHTNTLNPMHTSQDHRSGSVETEAGWTLSWESNGAEREAELKHLAGSTASICKGGTGYRGSTGENTAEAWQWLFMRTTKPEASLWKHLGGGVPSATTNGNK